MQLYTYMCSIATLAVTEADQASRLQNDAALERRAAARVLRDTGLTYTDIGVALGISYQRARQLVLEDPAIQLQFVDG